MPTKQYGKESLKVPNQPTVPWYVQASVVVLGSMDAAALAYQDPAFILPPAVRFTLFLGNVGFIALAAFFNIKNGKQTP